ELARAVGRHIPTLAEVLDLVAGRMLAHVDVKEPEYEVEVVTAALDTLGPDGFVITGEDAVVRAAKSADPRVRTALSLGRGPFEIPLSRQVQVRHSELWPLRRVRACGADGVAMHHGLARAGALRTVARAGVPAMIWTVNDARLIRRFLYDPRVAVLVTNYPGLALRERGGPLGHPPGPLGWGNHV
ncbi:MAG TPA: glycerophosphodiester phosphodiesterase, partial [Rugosimonospora sp.]|nr:glycerophosphodiester phosphodiesterase [Rugosimonospora sp.]